MSAVLSQANLNHHWSELIEQESCLQPGQLLRVKSGSLARFEGRLVSRRGDNRVLIAVDGLPGVLIQICETLVEAAEDRYREEERWRREKLGEVQRSGHDTGRVE